MSALSELTYPQQQFTVSTLVVALWMAIEVFPERWWPRRWPRAREVVTTAARFVGGTVAVTLAMVYLRTHIAARPKPEMWAVFIAVTLISAFFLTRREYLRRFVPAAGPDELGVLRFAIGATLFYLVARDDLISSLLIPESMLRRYGMVWELQKKLGSAAWLLDIRNPTWLRLVYWTALLSSLTTMLGLLSRISAPICALSFMLFYHTLCSYSHFFHVGLIPLLVLVVLLFFPTGASFSVDAIIRKRRGKHPITAQPEVWSRGVYAAWLMYGVSYWAAGGSKLAQKALWNGETLRRYAVKDSDLLMEFDFDLTQHLVAWNLDEWIFYPAAVAVLFVEVCALWVLFSGRARRWFPPLLVSFHVGVIYLQGIAFFDLMILPLAFIPARYYRQLGTKLRLGKFIGEGVSPPSIEKVVERRDRNLARVLLVAMLPALIATGWLFRVERFPLLTRWGMFEGAVRGDKIGSLRLYAVYADGSRVRTDLGDDIRALNNTRWRDTVVWPSHNTRMRRIGLKRMQDLFNSTGALQNEGKPEAEHIVRYELDRNIWKVEEDRDNPNWGVTARTMVFVVGDEQHPQEQALWDREKRERDKKKAAKKAAAKRAAKRDTKAPAAKRSKPAK